MPGPSAAVPGAVSPTPSIRNASFAELGHAGAGYAPSYAESQFDTIVRRQRLRKQGALKMPHRKGGEDFAMVSEEREDYLPRVVHEWEFSGWGTMSYMEVSPAERDAAAAEQSREEVKSGTGSLGRWLSTGVAGVAVAGSPLYSFPPVVLVAGVYSPLSLLISGLLLSFWRPIMVELANALPQSGANYLYLLNGSASKLLAVTGAVLTLLDDVLCAVVSAATASSYIAHQGHLPFPDAYLTVIILGGIGLTCMSGVKLMARATSALLAFHLACMLALFVAGVVQWSRSGNDVLRENWVTGQPGGAARVAKSVFQGVCIGFLGATGFETAPDYKSQIREGLFPSVLRNLQIITIAVNAPILLVTYAVLPSSQIVGNATVLNTLASTAAGRALSIVMTLDASLILCAGILTGILSADALIERLAVDGILPSFLLYRLPITHAPALSSSFFIALCLVVYGASGGGLSIMSGVFSFTFLSTLFLFPISSLILSFNRPRLPRTPRPSLLLTSFTLSLAITLIVGNSVLAPQTVGYFAAYAIVLFALVFGMSHKAGTLKLVWWVIDHAKRLRGVATRVTRAMVKLRGGPVVVFVETDAINLLFERILYVRRNEDTSCVKLVHCYRSINGIPSELEANYKILDEAFPSTTIDLIFVEGDFCPSLANVVAARLGVARQLCFMGSPGPAFGYHIGEFAGVRIIGP